MDVVDLLRGQHVEMEDTHMMVRKSITTLHWEIRFIGGLMVVQNPLKSVSE